MALNFPTSESNPSMHLHEVLAAEFTALHGQPAPPGTELAVPPGQTAEEDRARKEKQEQHLKHIWTAVHGLPAEGRRAALCISGGGTRSAAFTLGILQGLARAGLLGKFHYLSTVAGGGFIGGWLTAWVLRAEGGLNEVLTDLCQGSHADRVHSEPPELRNLRASTDYLSPRLSLLSLETWTLLATYLRNLVLNWLVLVPLLAAVLMVPWIYLAILMKSPPPFTSTPLWLGCVCLVIGLSYIGLSVPSGRRRPRDDKDFLWFCLLPVFLGAVSITIQWAWFRNYGGETPKMPLLPGMSSQTFPPFLWFGLGLLLVAWLFLGLRRREFRLFEFVAVIISGALTGTLMWFGPIKLSPQPFAVIELYFCFAIPFVIGVFLVAINALTGLSSRSTGDSDREWFARATGWFLVISVFWILTSLLLLFGTFLRSWLASWTIPKLTIGGIVGALTLVVGRSNLFLAALKKRDITGRLTRILLEGVAIAGLLFVATMLMNLTIWIIKQLAPLFNVDWNLQAVSGLLGKADASLNVVLYAPSWLVTAVALGLAVFGLIIASLVNPKMLSLHATFRQRIIRTYLGASNRQRVADPFTGFDERDNPRMADLWPREKFGAKLMPVINIGANPASKLATSFTVSPLHCGSWQLGYRSTGGQPGACYGGSSGITLGTAMTISGATPGSNRGYHSSPLVMFILSLLNFRLGVWLGNPGPFGDKTFQLGSPRFSVLPIIAETFDLADDTSPYIYLSDGRHFDSVGLYEMVLRRCHYIVVSDAGADPDFSFTNLAEAIRKIRFDFGIPIEFGKMKLYPRKDDEAPKPDRQHCAVGRIRYAAVDGPEVEDGVLVYIKPVFYGDEPLDVYEYSKTSKNFPHESAGDQFFTESRLDSYRALGVHIMQKLCPQDRGDLREFVGNIERHDPVS
jgi:hypothetical protein